MSAKDDQIGGDHYRTMAIQPVEFITKNKLNFLEGCVIKRVCRHRNKDGRRDLEKAIHELQLLMDAEYPKEEPKSETKLDKPKCPKCGRATRFDFDTGNLHCTRSGCRHFYWDDPILMKAVPNA